jgi:hypothetical protein
MESADVPLRIEFESFKRRQTATVATIAAVVNILASSQIAVVDHYTDLAAEDYHQYSAIFLIADIDGSPAMLRVGDSGNPVDNRNQFEDLVGTKFMRATIE